MAPMKRRALQLVLFVAACAVVYAAGMGTAFAFSCSAEGCESYAEGQCGESGGVQSVEYEESSGFCHGKCNGGEWILAYCDGV